MTVRTINSLSFTRLMSVTLLLSAFLLFLIQPMVGKYLLPLFGGVSMVWAVCMLYFQTILLIGYAYVYGMNRFFTFKKQKFIHCSFLVLSLCQLPILWTTMPSVMGLSPTITLLWILALKLTFPLCLLCSTAPLLQSWFAMTGNIQAKDPYFLYVASNTGSFIALLGYPFLIEKYSGLHLQSTYWTLGYIIYSVMILLVIGRVKVSQRVTRTQSLQPLSLRQRLYWITLSFIPVSLMLGVTTYLTTDVASIPLIWVVPLAIYLLTFIITFSKKPLISHQFIKNNVVLVLIFTVLSLIIGRQEESIIELMLIHFVSFFMLAMLCHGELIKNRPSVLHLSEYYLWIAFGGVLGGVFNSILSPLLFKNAYEYPIAIILAILVLPSKGKKMNVKQPVIISCLMYINYLLPKIWPHVDSTHIHQLIILVFPWFNITYVIPILCIIYMVLAKMHSKQFALSLSIIFIFSFMLPDNAVLWQGRNFFGIKKVIAKNNLHVLINQTTVHGFQMMDKGVSANNTLAYYKPVHDVLTRLKNEKKRAAIIGLGIGIIGCQFNNNDEVDYFEVDPEVLALAKNPNYFTLLRDCKAKTQFKLGDARLNLMKEKDNYYNIIILDAFNSDAIPTHLLTAEALSLYTRKLKKEGVLLVHLSNRHVELEPVLSAFSLRHHMRLYIQKKETNRDGQFTTIWGLISSNSEMNERVTKALGFVASHASPVLWTDDYSNILPLLK